VISEWKPESVIILAWQYAEPITRRNQGYLEGGGEFILPLPEVRTL
jgi:hypothetical protein